MDVKNDIIEILKKEAQAILEVSKKVDDNVNKAIELMIHMHDLIRAGLV